MPKQMQIELRIRLAGRVGKQCIQQRGKLTHGMTLSAIIACRIGSGHICQDRSKRSIGNFDAGAGKTHGISSQDGSAGSAGQHGTDGLNGLAKNGAHGVVAQYVAGGAGTVIGHG